jgi:hypothetical protein
LKKNSRFLSPWALVGILIILSCEKDPPPEPIDFAYDLYPIATGDLGVFEVDSLVYNDFTGEVDSFRYQMREQILDSFTDLEGRLSYKLERSFRPNDSSEWTIRDVWSLTKTAERLESREENIAYIKLVFPMDPSKEWNGNALNALGEEEFEVMSFDSLGNVLGTDEKLCRVQHFQRENLIERQSRSETYARGIGPVEYRSEYIFTKTDGINPQNDVDSGFTRFSRILDYHVQ